MYDKQIWDTTSYVNPTRMNHIEQGIYDADLTSGGNITGDLTVDSKNGTTAERGYGLLVIGNNKPEGTAENTRGLLDLYGTTAYRARLVAGALTGNRQIEFPDKAGTICLLESLVPIAFNQEVDVTANVQVSTSVDWGQVDLTKVLYSWVAWNNPSSDTPNVMIYYYNTTVGREGVLSKISHKWSVTQRVSFRVMYIRKG